MIKKYTAVCLTLNNYIIRNLHYRVNARLMPKVFDRHKGKAKKFITCIYKLLSLLFPFVQYKIVYESSNDNLAELFHKEYYIH